jgi:elongation of very long chain fatty acids protein 6
MDSLTSIPFIKNAIDNYLHAVTSVYEPWWVSSTWPHSIPIITVVGYLSMVFGLPHLLLMNKSTRNGISVGKIMPLWNLFLSVWSFFMAVGIGIPYLSHMINEGYFETVCDEGRKLYEPNTMGFWAHMFVASKFAELVDTLFLILKHPSRPVPFLHWYHHTTVLLFTWYADLYQYTGGIFMIVNATIHTFMYYYYFLKETGHNPTWALPLTLGQISQMFIGIFVNGTWIYMRWFQNRQCPCKEPEIITAACLVMYASYAYLFLDFFFRRYVLGSSNTASKKARKEE